MDISIIDISMKSKPVQSNPDLLLLEDFARFRRALNLHFSNALRPLGLGVKQASLLRFLAKRGKASLAELSRDTMTDPAAMTRVVNVLLGGGLVSQKEHPTDKRRWVLALTPRGQRLTVEVERIYLLLSEGSLKALSAGEKTRFSNILKKLFQYLSVEKNEAIPMANNPHRRNA